MDVWVEMVLGAGDDAVALSTARLLGVVDLDSAYQPVPLPPAEEDASRLAPGDRIVLVRGEMAPTGALEEVVRLPGVLRAWRDAQIEPS